MERDVRKEWASALSKSLKRWMHSSEFWTTTALAIALDVPHRQMRSILSGKTISRTTEYYARVFIRTGLPEADPRKIPDRLQKMPHSPATLIKVAWTDEAYVTWLQQEGKKYLAVEAPTYPPEEVPQGESKHMQPSEIHAKVDEVSLSGQGPPGESGFLEDMLGVITSHVSRKIPPGLTEQQTTQLESAIQAASKSLEKTLLSETSQLKELIIQSQLPSPSSKPVATVIKQDTDPGVLARRLTEQLMKAVNGQAEDRDRLSERYGHDFGRLLPLLDAFTSEPVDRDRLLRQQGKLNADSY